MERNMPMQKLLDVQKVDLKIKELETEAAAIPPMREEWDRSLEGKKAELTELQSEIEESKKAQRHLERRLEERQEDLAKFNAQLPMIKTNREYKAILLEVDSVEKDIFDIEEQVLQIMADVESAETKAVAKEAEVDAAREEAGREKDKLQQKQRELEESLRGSRSERDNLAAHVDASVLTQYDRIRPRKGGLGMARITGESCGACHLMLPPQVVNEVIGGAVKSCPSCTRLLYWMET
jgi:predicted  nucleic acid-binding Zn-ribbon protein